MIGQKVQQLAENINGLSLRERGLLMLACLAVIFLLWDGFLMSPVRERQSTVQDELEQIRGRVAQLTTSIQNLATRPDRDADRALQGRVRALEDEIARLEQDLEQQFAGAVRPRHAVDVLAGLLEGHAGLTVTALENLPPETLDDGDGATVTGMYVHRIRVSVEGDHASLRNYLARIADLPRGIFLESMHLSVPAWPVNRIDLIFYSLTLDDSWLGV
ncbi:MAG: hypothetical protein EA419_06455 [Wenzhouxiangella sp.]|nr:MAG: hypothetical protein EA419_06455 [Wenzhouxiangella sp.]